MLTIKRMFAGAACAVLTLGVFAPAPTAVAATTAATAAIPTRPDGGFLCYWFRLCQ